MRVVDGAAIGLSYLARLSVDVEARSAVAPFAIMAVGAYGAGVCDSDTILELQYLLPEDQESWERGTRIVTFIRSGLAALGLQNNRDAMGTADECAWMARGDPTAAARFATARLLSGQYGLYAGFLGMLGGVQPAAMPTARRRRENVCRPGRPAFEDCRDAGCD
jgi:UTP:GlnB (protein PII) uridylyltransferase